MSSNVKATIAAVVILLIAIWGAYEVASSVSTESDTEELVNRLQSISQQIVDDSKDKKLNEIMTISKQNDDVTITLSYTDNNIIVTVSSSVTEIITNLDYDWNITSKSVDNLSKLFGPLMVFFTLSFIIVGFVVWALFVYLFC